MADPSLLPEQRLCQYLDKTPWKNHIHRHYEKYVQIVTDEMEQVECPHMRCVSTFNSVNYLKFHLFNIHYFDFITKLSIIEMPDEGFEVELDRAKMLRRSTKMLSIGLAEGEYRFIDEMSETACRNQLATTLTIPCSRYALSYNSLQGWGWTDDESTTSVETLPSSIHSDTPTANLGLLRKYTSCPSLSPPLTHEIMDWSTFGIQLTLSDIPDLTVRDIAAHGSPGEFQE